jgi:hypothetical protein
MVKAVLPSERVAKQPDDQPHGLAKVRMWFCLSLLCAAAMGGLCLYKTSSAEFIVNDDARQHVFWMQRWLDPELFPGDAIADYFQAVAPIGYQTLYRGFTLLGWSPLFTSYLLPPVLIVVTAAFSFGICWQVFPVPLAGFFTSVLLSQNLLLTDDVLSATPRAFAYPLLAAFLYFWLRRSLWLCSASILLLGLFYPQTVLLACGCLLLGLFEWHKGRLWWAPPQDWQLSVIGLMIGGALVAYYATDSLGRFEPTVTLAAARQLPEFAATGRSKFFTPPLDFFVTSARSGLFPRYYQMVQPPLLLVGLGLPFLLRSPQRYPLVKWIRPGKNDMLRLFYSSFLLWGAAHLLLFRLHLPSRYTQYSFRILLAIATGIALTLLLDRLRRWSGIQNSQRRWRFWLPLGVLWLSLLLYPTAALLREFNPALRGIVRTLPGYEIGNDSGLYRFLATQPKNAMIASLTKAADNIPTFARRSVLVAREYAIPYHSGYYQPLRQRAIALLEAQYSSDPQVVQHFIQTYGVSLWLLEAQSFTPDTLVNRRDYHWLHVYEPAFSQAVQQLQTGQPTIVQAAIPDCTVFAEHSLVVLDAACISRNGSVASSQGSVPSANQTRHKVGSGAL